MLTRTAHNLATDTPPPALGLFPAQQARPLAPAAQAEVLSFLAARPVHTVTLTSMIRDHGLVSPLHRGRFYGARDEMGRLEGVALVGHSTLFEARTDCALAAFALATRQTTRKHLIMGESAQVARFWQYMAGPTAQPRRAARELLYTLGFPLPVGAPVSALRPARAEELDLILPVQAELALAESGVDPLDSDPRGFHERCLRRIAQGRTWAVVAAGQLLFKAELQAVTPDAIYLEGIYVHPSERGRGFGADCLGQLCRMLLSRTKNVSLLVNEQHTAAQALYRKVGFRQRGSYDSIFLSQG